MKRTGSTVPGRMPRVKGSQAATWFRPAQRPLSVASKRMVLFLGAYFYLPAVRAFYTPHRHQTTNVQECVRLFWHAERFVDRFLEEEFGVNTKKERIAVRGWVNYRLTDEDKARIELEPLDMTVVIAEYMALVYGGYRLSVTYDEYSKAMQASLVCAKPDSPDAGLGMSSRHPDLDWALRSLLYKVQVVGVNTWDKWLDGPTPESWS